MRKWSGSAPILGFEPFRLKDLELMEIQHWEQIETDSWFQQGRSPSAKCSETIQSGAEIRDEMEEKRLVSAVRKPITHNDDAVAIRSLPPDTIEFEEVKVSQSNANDSFTLSLCTSVKVSLMVM
jgi:hypothetical protein